MSTDDPARPEPARPGPADPAHPDLARRIGLGGAVGIGLASMIGAGAFFVWAPAAAAAGQWMLAALVVAGAVATLNAFSSAQLAMAHPVSGGAYAFGRRYVGPWTGFAAGWLFVTGKTASAAAIAAVAAAYLGGAIGLGSGETRMLAVALIAVFAALNMSGVRTTARVSIAIVAVVLAGLAAWFVAVALAPPPTIGWVDGAESDLGGGGAGSVAVQPSDALLALTEPTLVGVAQAAALLFFAFAGYARMATLGAEVREPRRTLPRAILLALGVVLALYAALAVVLLDALGAEALAASDSPLADAIDPAWAIGIAALAGLACLGSLTGILAGLSRTSLAMAREHDLPGPLARVSARTRAPIIAEAAIAVVAIVIVLLLEPAQLVASSSAAVLLYYAIAHLSVLRQPAVERWQPRALALVGLVGCVGLAAALPLASLVGTAVLLAAGIIVRALAGRRRRSSTIGPGGGQPRP